MSDSNFSRLISELGEALGISGLAPSDEGVCQLVFDARHPVQLIAIHARGIVLLSCPVGLSKADAQQISLMVQANFMQAGAGAIICIGPDQRNYLQFGMPMLGTTTATDVLCAIELLLNQVETWEARLIYDSNTTVAPRLGPEHWMKSV